MEQWMRKRLKEAKDSLVEYDIPRKLLRSSIQIHTDQITCRAYVCEGESTIHVAWWWAKLCYETDDEWAVERLMRHELTHLICDRVDEVREAFRIPEYPSETEMNIRRIGVALGVMKYGDTHPEEKLAECVGDLSPRTLNKLARVVNA
jgi:hypothetical protein